MPVKEFYFAWVQPDEEFDPNVHNREDEKIVRFSIDQSEGEFANLSIDIRNPKIGLLNAGRKLWAYLSYHNGTDVVALFFGRIVGIPSNIHRQVVTLEFMARPTTFSAQKAILAESLRHLPYWDPVFIKPEMWEDPDVVLEGRTELWHTDRINHSVTTSDLLVGEDGVLEFQEDEVPDASVQLTFDQPPIRRVRVVADVTWEQNVEGSGIPILKNWMVPTVAAAGVISSWPKPTIRAEGIGIAATLVQVFTKGTDLGGGWFAWDASAHSPYEKLETEDWAGWWLSRYPQGADPLPYPEPPFKYHVISSYSASTPRGGPAESSVTKYAIIDDYAVVNLTAGYQATRTYQEKIVFELVADSQPIITDPDDEEILDLAITGNDISLPDPLSGYTVGPIGSTSFRTFFAQDRGKQSLQYLIQLARANIILRSRAVRVVWQCPFDRAAELSLRKSALLHHREMPGGQVVGKIVAYSLKSEGGRVYGELTIGSCIGYGGSIAPTDGDPTYVADDYADDYQARDNQINVLGAGDVGFVSIISAPNDDGLVFPLRYFPKTFGPLNVTTYSKGNEPIPLPMTWQSEMKSDDCGNTTNVTVRSSIDTGPYNDWLSGVETVVKFQMKAVESGPFETLYPVITTPLRLPKQIDLEAAETP